MRGRAGGKKALTPPIPATNRPAATFRCYAILGQKRSSIAMATSTKAEVLRMIGEMPESASLDEMIYQVYFRQRVDRGLRELARGKTVSHEEVERSLTLWLKSAGR